MAEGNSIRVRLVTPDRVFVDGTADAVSLPGLSGELEALYGHAPLLTELGAGNVMLHGGDIGEKQIFVAWGFAEVLPDRVTILAESAEMPSEISLPDARAQLERGNRMWREAGDESARYTSANLLIYEAEEKIATAEGSGKSA